MTTTNSAEKPTLTDFLRGISKPIIDPIVNVMAKIGLKPDFLTVLGMLGHIWAAWLIVQGEMRWAAVVVWVFGSLDAFDGALSRKLGRKPSGFGAFLDSTLDRISEILLYGGFIIFFQDSVWWQVAAYATITGSIMVSYSRARAEGLGIPCKVGIFSRVERYFVIWVAMLFNAPQYGLLILAFGSFFTVAQRMYEVFKNTRE